MSHPRALRVVATLALAAALLAAGCGGDDGGAAGDSDRTAADTFVGTVEGTDAYIALITDGERVTGYVCDGRKLSTWVEPAAIEDGDAALRSGDGEPLGSASLATEGATGSLELDGETHEFSAERASGDAGLYRAAVGEPGERGFVEAGWIVLADGSLRGAKNSFIDLESDFVVAPAPSFTGTGSGGEGVVDLGDGTGTTDVQKLDPSFSETGSDI